MMRRVFGVFFILTLFSVSGFLCPGLVLAAELQPAKVIPVIPDPESNPAPVPTTPSDKDALKNTLQSAPGIPQQGAANPYADLPQEYIDEAYGFYDNCYQNVTLTNYYDCKCLAMKYLGKRIDLGPTVNPDEILENIKTECKDATQAAGAEYTTCLRMARLLHPKKPLPEFCKCYANTYAKYYQDSKTLSPNSQTFVHLQGDAYSACMDPEQEDQLYPKKK